MSAGVLFDAGALIALERADRRVVRLVDRARSGRAAVTIPAPVLAQVSRDPATQVRLQRLLRLPSTQVVPFDRGAAHPVGAMLRRSGTSDFVDGHVVLCALQRQLPIVTSDPDDLRRLDGSVRLVEV